MIFHGRYSLENAFLLTLRYKAHVHLYNAQNCYRYLESNSLHDHISEKNPHFRAFGRKCAVL